MIGTRHNVGNTVTLGHRPRSTCGASASGQSAAKECHNAPASSSTGNGGGNRTRVTGLEDNPWPSARACKHLRASDGKGKACASGVLPLHYAVRDASAKRPAGKAGVEIRFRLRESLLLKQVIIHHLRPAGHLNLLDLPERGPAQERKESNPRRRVWNPPFYH